MTEEGQQLVTTGHISVALPTVTSGCSKLKSSILDQIQAAYVSSFPQSDMPLLKRSNMEGIAIDHRFLTWTAHISLRISSLQCKYNFEESLNSALLLYTWICVIAIRILPLLRTISLNLRVKVCWQDPAGETSSWQEMPRVTFKFVIICWAKWPQDLILWIASEKTLWMQFSKGSIHIVHRNT